MEKIIVTGGAGFIGSHLVDALVREGYDVHVIDTLVSGNQEDIHPKATFHLVDIRDTDTLITLFKDVSYVFHHAALPQVELSIQNPIETHDVNVNGLLSVLEASRHNGVKKIVFAASSAAYGNQKTLPLVETMNPMPLSPYGLHKYIGEVYCRLWSEIYELKTVSLRYFNVYGPRQSAEGAYASVIARFMKFLKENQPLTITGDGNQMRDFVHVRDVVAANIAAMKSEDVGNGEVINIGGTKMYSVNKIAELIGGERMYIPPRIEPKQSSADISRAKELLSWTPTISLEEGIAELKTI